MKKIQRVIINILVILIIVGIVIGICIYYINKPRIINKSKDGEYTIYFIETEAPTFFSQSKVCILLESENNEKYEFNAEISNDGKRLDDTNWKVIWEDDCVIVVLKGEEQEDEEIKIPYIERNYKNFTKSSFNNKENNKKYSFDSNMKTPQEKLDKMRLNALIKIPNSKYGIIEMDHAMAQSLWYFVEILNDKMVFISEIPDNSPSIEAAMENEKIILICEDINSNITNYESVDNGKTWQTTNKVNKP